MPEFTLQDLIKQARMVKSAFVPAQQKEAAAGGMVPMDPAMMGGAMPPPPPGAPMDPAMAGGMPPMDPAMMTPPPPEGADPMGVPPPPEGPDADTEIQELMQVVSQMAEGMDKIESKQEALEAKYHETMSQFDEMRGKIDMLINILEGKKSGI